MQTPHNTMTIDPHTRREYRRMLAKRWYSLSGVESVRKAVVADEELDENAREELVKISDRRVDEIIDARLGIQVQ